MYGVLCTTCSIIFVILFLEYVNLFGADHHTTKPYFKNYIFIKHFNIKIYERNFADDISVKPLFYYDYSEKLRHSIGDNPYT